MGQTTHTTDGPDMTRGRIDVHHHFLSREYVKGIGPEQIAAQGSSRSAPDWTVETSLELMDHAGIETAIFSISAPGVDTGKRDASVRLCRQSNEAQARLAGDYPGRFGFFAALPLPYFEAAGAEVTAALDSLKADGVTILTNYGGKYFGDPVYWPLLEDLNERGAIVFIHPTSPYRFDGFTGVSPSTLEFPFDTTRALACCLYHGIAQRFAKIKFIWSHAGGAMPYVAGRMAVLSERNPEFIDRGLDRVAAALRSFYYDITQSASRATFGALREIAPFENLLFGTDCPMAGKPQVDVTLRQIAEMGLTGAQQHALDRGNALRLLPRFA